MKQTYFFLLLIGILLMGGYFYWLSPNEAIVVNGLSELIKLFICPVVAIALIMLSIIWPLKNKY